MIPSFSYKALSGIKRSGTLIVLLLVGGTAAAQERLTLRQAIDLAIERNFTLRAARNTADQAGRSNTWGAAGALPTVTLNGTAQRGVTTSTQQFSDPSRPVQSVNGAQSQLLSASADVDWTIYNGGRVRLSKKQLGAIADREDARLREQLQTIVSQTIQAYAAAVYQQQQGIAIDTGLALAATRMYLSKVKFDLGTSAKTDFLQARVDYNARQSDSLAQEAALVRAFADLDALLAVDVNTVYIVDDSLQLNMELQPMRPELLDERNPTIDIARRTADISRLDFRIARSAQYPFVGLSGGYAYSRNTNQAGLVSLNQGLGPTGRIGVAVPLYQGGTIRRNITIAGLEAARNELLFEQQRTETARQYRRAWADYRSSVASYRLEQENIGYAKENLDIQAARFRLGVGTTLEAREAENSYVQALVRLYTAAYNLKVNEVAVLALEGTLVE